MNIILNITLFMSGFVLGAAAVVFYLWVSDDE